MIIPTPSAHRLRELADEKKLTPSDLARELAFMARSGNLALKPSVPTIKAHLTGQSEPGAQYMMLYKLAFGLEKVDDLYDVPGAAVA